MVTMLKEKIETSVMLVSRCSAASAPAMAMPPTSSGSAAATSPPKTTSESSSTIGRLTISARSRSAPICELICRLMSRLPPKDT